MCLFKQILNPKLIVVYFIFTIISGCNAVRLVYNQGDTLTYWWLDDHIGFNSEQETFTRSSLEHLFWWHRTEQLQAISITLDKAQQKLQKPTSKQEIMALTNDLKKHGYSIFDQIIPDAAKLVISLQPGQIDSIEKRFAKNNEKFRKEFLPDNKDKQVKIRADKVIDRTEWLFGALSKEQEKRIREFLIQHPVDMEMVYKERLRRQSDLIQICKEVNQKKLNQKATESLLKDYMKFFEAGRTKDQQVFNKNWMETGAEVTSFITQVMNDEQRQYAFERIGGWLGDIGELIRDSSALAAKRSALLNR